MNKHQYLTKNHEVCSRCGGSVRVIACIEDQDVIDRILAHLRETEKEAPGWLVSISNRLGILYCGT